MTFHILDGDCRQTLATLPERSVRTCVTSPPYFRLRDYGVTGQMGLEATPDAFVAELVAVFREVRRVLTDDGTLWLNLGDSYASYRDGKATPDTARGDNTGTLVPQGSAKNRSASTFSGSAVKHKDLIGIPWRVAFALQADGWYLRSDIIWHKPNPMPESVTDRPTKSHEYLFLLAKSERYYYDSGAIAEPLAEASVARGPVKIGGTKGENYEPSADDPNFRNGHHQAGRELDFSAGGTRNKRTVWTVNTQPFKGAHFATFPPALIEPCILAGSAKGDTVLDPFGGAGTTALVADRLGRNAILCEINPAYAEITRRRVLNDAPLFVGEAGR